MLEHTIEKPIKKLVFTHGTENKTVPQITGVKKLFLVYFVLFSRTIILFDIGR